MTEPPPVSRALVPPVRPAPDDNWHALYAGLVTAAAGGSTSSLVALPDDATDELAVRWQFARSLLPTLSPELLACPPRSGPAGVLLDLVLQLRRQFEPFLTTSTALEREYGWSTLRLASDVEAEPRSLIAFQIGGVVLVAPAVAADVLDLQIPLPNGIWYDYWTDVALQGGAFVQTRAPLERLPLYVRGGAVVPLRLLAPATADTGLKLRVYAGDLESALYEDSGAGSDYLNGNFRWVYMTCRLQEGSLSVTRRVAGRYAPEYGSLLVEVIGLEARPYEVLVDRRSAPLWFYEQGRLELTVSDDFNQLQITTG